ncbi:MAG: hypothetical protein AB1640_14695 [bacterium]
MARRYVPSPPPPAPKRPSRGAKARSLQPDDRIAWDSRLLLTIESPDPRLLDKEAGKLYHRIAGSGARVRGPIPLEVRSVPPPSAQGTDLRLHRRLFLILFPKEETVSILEKLSLSESVHGTIEVEEAGS